MEVINWAREKWWVGGIVGGIVGVVGVVLIVGGIAIAVLNRTLVSIIEGALIAGMVCLFIMLVCLFIMIVCLVIKVFDR